MVANLVNVILGLLLVYTAVLQPSLAAQRPFLLLAVAAVILVAAWMARPTDHHPWQNNTNMLLAVILGVVAGLRLEHYPLAVFWSQFSIGTIVSVLALWAILYRPAPAPT